MQFWTCHRSWNRGDLTLLSFLINWLNKIVSFGCSAENIAEDAEKHIHQQDVILTVGKSRTVQRFLMKAKSKKRRFEVIVAICGPFYTVSFGLSLKEGSGFIKKYYMFFVTPLGTRNGTAAEESENSSDNYGRHWCF